MNSTGARSPFLLAFLTVSSVDSTVTPFFNACVLAFCIVGPSAIGSVKGKPSSMRSVKRSVNTSSAVRCQIERTGATSFHAQEDVDGFISGGKASCDICDEGGSLFSSTLCEGTLDMFHNWRLEVGE